METYFWNVYKDGKLCKQYRSSKYDDRKARAFLEKNGIDVERDAGQDIGTFKNFKVERVLCTQ